MNNSPIDFLLAFLLFSFESVCWLINEFAGFHDANYLLNKGKAKALKTYVAAVEKLDSMTKRQLQDLTGLKSSRYSKFDLVYEASLGARQTVIARFC